MNTAARERSRRRRSHPQVVTLMMAMAIAAEHRGQDARVTIGGLHEAAYSLLHGTPAVQKVLEQLYIDAVLEDQPGYAMPNFWKALKCLWMDRWVEDDLGGVWRSAELREAMRAQELEEIEVSNDVNFAFYAMLKKEGSMIQVERQNPHTGYEFMHWVAPSTYEVA